MVTTTGPRKLVLGNIKDQVSGNLQAAPSNIPSIQPGSLRIHSSEIPGLELGQTYTANFTQTVTVPGQSLNPVLESQRKFKVSGSPYVLDSSLVDSVYPPPGHSDYWNVLPHVLFNNQRAPWLFEVDNTNTPWLALLVFTEAELTLTTDQKTAINNVKSLNETPTFAHNLQVSDLAQINSLVAQPIPIASAADPTPVQVILIQSDLYSNLFGTYSGIFARADTSNTTPDLTRYKFMSHVRAFNTLQKANLGGSGQSSYSATVSPRTGTTFMASPTTFYAHLVSLSGLTSTNMQLNQGKPTALISLYSWSFTYLPSASYSVTKALSSLGNTLQPLRSPDTLYAAVAPKKVNPTIADRWVTGRMLAGFSLIRYRTPTGEPTIALQRGFLTAMAFDTVDFPPSDYGSDLAVIDEDTGLLDLTFQLAWELGRVSAMADRAVSAALMRLRKDIHSKTLATAKDTLDDTFISGPTVLQRIPSLNTTFSSRIISDNGFLPQRWSAAVLGTSSRDTLSFRSPAVQSTYSGLLQSGIGVFANGHPKSASTLESISVNVAPPHLNPFMEVDDSPISSDYALILEWLMDRWVFQGIPFTYLVPDPGFLPKESIRSFYVDQSWFKIFTDGALSIAEHFDEGDDVRESIKTSLTTYLNTIVPATGFVPQIPKWGFFIRSELVTKFPDLQISAPFKETAKQGRQSEVLRMDTLDVDLLCVLFDRYPSDFDPVQGISLRPPEHQSSSMFGSISGIQANNNVTINWKKVWRDLSGGLTPASYSTTLAPLTFDITDPRNGIYDSSCQTLIPTGLAKNWPVQDPHNDTNNVPGVTPALVGSQLIATVPQLQLLDQVLLNANAGAQSSANMIPSSLSTSKPRPNAIVSETSREPLLSLPPPSNQSAIQLPSFPAPVNPIIGAIAKTDILYFADSNVRALLFPGPYTGVSSPSANILIGSNVPGMTTQLSTDVFNVRGTYFDQGSTSFQSKTTLVACTPQSLGLRTDLHIAMISLATAPYYMTSTVLTFSVGTVSSGALLATFPTNSSPIISSPNSHGEYPVQPTTQGVVVPNVRLTAIGRRWRINTTYSSNNNVISNFTITITPNVGTPGQSILGPGQCVWDISQIKDLSFVIENVVLNWAPLVRGTGYENLIHVDEYYINATNEARVAQGIVKRVVRAVDVRRSDLVFATSQ